jgi:hydroxymethylbilane synthase
MKNIIRIATRNSPLALKQANMVKDLLTPSSDCKIISMSSSGDTVSQKAFKEHGGKGLFLKELEESLLKGNCDIAVHSLKDVPAVIDKKFKIITISKREVSSDVLVSDDYESIEEMPKDSIIGTSSPRRAAILRNISQDFKIIDIRGNIHTRLTKMNNKNLDGIILAAAGLRRMGLENKIRKYLSLDKFVPSAGQGILCIELLRNEKKIEKILEKLCVKNVQDCADIERQFVRAIDGDCMSPIGVHARINKNKIIIDAYVSTLDGKRHIKVKHEDDVSNKQNVGEELADIFLKQGAKKLLGKSV